MAAVAGYAALVKNATNTLATITDAELPIASEMYDTSALNGGRAKTFIAGLYDSTLNLKLNWDASDTNGLIAFQTNILGASPSVIAFTFSANGGTNNYTFNGWIKDLKVHAPVNNKVEADATVQVTGAVSYS